MSSSEKQDQQPHEPAFVIAAPQVIARLHGAIVAAIGRADGRADDCAV